MGRALRDAASDFYFNSWRLVPANLLWGALLVAVIVATAFWLPAALLTSVLAVPVAGMHRMAAMLQRGQPTGFSDFAGGMRRFWGPAIALGLTAVLLAVIFTANVFAGLEMGGVMGWSFSALALYADIGLAMFLVSAWPILVDPFREDEPVGKRLRLAALVNLARPARMFLLTALITTVLLVSAVLFAALLTVSVAFVSLFATRYVLPVADRLEGRRTKLEPILD